VLGEDLDPPAPDRGRPGWQGVLGALPASRPPALSRGAVSIGGLLGIGRRPGIGGHRGVGDGCIDLVGWARVPTSCAGGVVRAVPAAGRTSPGRRQCALPRCPAGPAPPGCHPGRRVAGAVLPGVVDRDAATPRASSRKAREIRGRRRGAGGEPIECQLLQPPADVSPRRRMLSGGSEPSGRARRSRATTPAGRPVLRGKGDPMTPRTLARTLLLQPPCWPAADAPPPETHRLRAAAQLRTTVGPRFLPRRRARRWRSRDRGPVPSNLSAAGPLRIEARVPIPGDLQTRAIRYRHLAAPGPDRASPGGPVERPAARRTMP
jgi:hypothetical protein